MATTFKEIDFADARHCDTIARLSAQNNFYEEDLRGLLFGEMDDKYIKEAAAAGGYDLSANQVRELLVAGRAHLRNQMLKNKPNNKGIFICVNYKVVGFIIYSLRKVFIVDLLFILIDEPFRMKGLGQLLVREMEERLAKTQYQYVCVDLKPAEISWYNKMNYSTLDEMMERGESRLLQIVFCQNKEGYIYLFKRILST